VYSRGLKLGETKGERCALGSIDPGRDVLNAQSRFFPAWWTYIGTPRGSEPLYRVVCASPDEIDLARAVEPEIVKAEYILSKPVR
jgi:hypothetical protein